MPVSQTKTKHTQHKKVNQLEENFDVFNQELTLATTHPLLYVASLLGGILAIIAGVVWVAQIMGTAITRDRQPLYLFVD